MPAFVVEALSGWRQHFDIRMDKAMEKRSKAIREVDLEIVADSMKDQNASLDWRFSVDGKTLD